MRRSALFLFAIAVMAFGCREAAKDQYTISGTVKGADTGKIYLMKFDSRWILTDSANIANGKFSFTGKVEMPEFTQLRIPSKNLPFSFFLENADIEVYIDADSAELSKVTGSASQDSYLAYLKEREGIDIKVEETEAVYKNAKEAKDSAGVEKAIVVLDSLESLYKPGIMDFVFKNPASVVSPFLIIRNAWNFDLEELDSMYNTIDTAARKSIYGKAIATRIGILQKVQIGQTAPDFTLPDTTGRSLSLSSLKGKYLLVDFWASWCGPCRRENPNVVAAYRNYNSRGFDILGVSFDKDREKWIQAVHDDQLAWNHVSDLAGWDNAAGKIYGINSIPSNVLLDPEQKIIGRNLTGEDLTRKLTEIFGQPVEKTTKAGKKGKK